MIQTAILAIGCIQLCRFLFAIIWQIVKQLIPARRHLQKYGQNEGKWAVVTGGTDGIGLGFCEVLCQFGWNVCIISRNQQKIKKTIENLSSISKINNKNCQFKYIVADFKNSQKQEFFKNICSELQPLEIGILVNNVGTGDIIRYEDMPLQQVIDTININCVSMAGLTSVLVQKMQKSKSAIINLSSFIGQNCAPYSTLYSATKAFNTFFSESLSMEKGFKNVDILSVKPMFVESPLSRQKKAFKVPDRRQCARACFKQLRWQYQTYGYFIHRIMGILAFIFPKWIRRIVATLECEKRVLSYHNS